MKDQICSPQQIRWTVQYPEGCLRQSRQMMVVKGQMKIVVQFTPPLGRQKSIELSIFEIKGISTIVDRHFNLAWAVRRIEDVSFGAEERMTRGMVERLSLVEIVSIAIHLYYRNGTCSGHQNSLGSWGVRGSWQYSVFWCPEHAVVWGEERRWNLNMMFLNINYIVLQLAGAQPTGFDAAVLWLAEHSVHIVHNLHHDSTTLLAQSSRLRYAIHNIVPHLVEISVLIRQHRSYNSPSSVHWWPAAQSSSPFEYCVLVSHCTKLYYCSFFLDDDTSQEGALVTQNSFPCFLSFREQYCPQGGHSVSPTLLHI